MSTKFETLVESSRVKSDISNTHICDSKTSYHHINTFTERMSNVATLIIFGISFVIASIIINKGQQIFMKLIGADRMLFSVRSKMTAITVTAILIFAVIENFLGI